MITIAKDQQSITRYEGAKSSNTELAAAAIGADVQNKVILLQAATKRGKIDLNDTETVKRITYGYMQNCSETGAIPTVMGLAASLGISRQWLNLFLREHPNSATAKFLDVTKEVFADAITQAGFYKHIGETLAIFILKNCASMSDRLEVEAIATSASTDEIDKEALFERIKGSIPAEDFDFDESEDY